MIIKEERVFESFEGFLYGRFVLVFLLFFGKFWGNECDVFIFWGISLVYNSFFIFFLCILSSRL